MNATAGFATAGFGAERTMKALFDALNKVQVQDRPVPVNYIQALMIVGMEKGTTIGEIASALNLEPSGAKRLLDNLGAYGRGDNPGLGLIESIDNPNNRSQKLFFLTRKGVERVGQMLECLMGDRPYHKPITAQEFMKKPHLRERDTSMRPRSIMD